NSVSRVAGNQISSDDIEFCPAENLHAVCSIRQRARAGGVGTDHVAEDDISACPLVVDGDAVAGIPGNEVADNDVAVSADKSADNNLNAVLAVTQRMGAACIRVDAIPLDEVSGRAVAT